MFSLKDIAVLTWVLSRDFEKDVREELQRQTRKNDDDGDGGAQRLETLLCGAMDVPHARPVASEIFRDALLAGKPLSAECVDAVRRVVYSLVASVDDVTLANCVLCLRALGEASDNDVVCAVDALACLPLGNEEALARVIRACKSPLVGNEARLAVVGIAVRCSRRVRNRNLVIGAAVVVDPQTALREEMQSGSPVAEAVAAALDGGACVSEVLTVPGLVDAMWRDREDADCATAVLARIPADLVCYDDALRSPARRARAIRALAQTPEASHVEVGAAAVAALTKVWLESGTPESLCALARVAGESARGVVAEAAQSFGVPLRTSQSPEVRRAAAHILDTIGDEGQIARVRQSWGRVTDAVLRGGVAEALSVACSADWCARDIPKRQILSEPPPLPPSDPRRQNKPSLRELAIKHEVEKSVTSPLVRNAELEARVQGRIDELLGKDRYVVKRVVGKGGFGDVVEATDTRLNQSVAIKVMNVDRTTPDAWYLRRLQRELVLLHHVRSCELIVPLSNVAVVAEEGNFGVCMVMLHVQYDLHSVLVSKAMALTEVHFRHLLHQLLLAVCALHSGGITHRDIKPSNILVTQSCGLYLCDFGLARSLTEFKSECTAETNALTEYIVSRWFRPPEILLETGSYGTAVDMWAVGCILGQMFNGGRPLFEGSSASNQLQLIAHRLGCPPMHDLVRFAMPHHLRIANISPGTRPAVPLEASLRGDIRSQTPDVFAKMLRGLLAFCPHERLTAEKALQHTYIVSEFGHQTPKRLRDPAPPDVHTKGWSVPRLRRFVLETVHAIAPVFAAQEKLNSAVGRQRFVVCSVAQPTRRSGDDDAESATVCTALDGAQRVLVWMAPGDDGCGPVPTGTVAGSYSMYDVIANRCVVFRSLRGGFDEAEAIECLCQWRHFATQDGQLETDHTPMDTAVVNPAGCVLDKRIGGEQWSVYKAVREKKSWAIKWFDLRTADCATCEKMFRIVRELKLLRHFKTSHNVVQIEECGMYAAPRGAFFVLQLSAYDMETLLCSKQPLTERHLQFFAFQIFNGLRVLHSAGVVHRNVKPTNILVSENCKVVLCDFGHGREEDETKDASKATVTRWYRSPEMLYAADRRAVSAATDVWSAATIVLQFFNGRKPLFPGKSEAQLVFMISRAIGLEDRDLVIIPDQNVVQTCRAVAPADPLAFWGKFRTPQDKNLSHNAQCLFESILRFHPDYRMSADCACKHSYVAEFGNRVENSPVSMFEEPVYNEPMGVVQTFELLKTELEKGVPQ